MRLSYRDTSVQTVGSMSSLHKRGKAFLAEGREARLQEDKTKHDEICIQCLIAVISKKWKVKRNSVFKDIMPNLLYLVELFMSKIPS